MTVDGLHALIKSMQGAFDKEISPKIIRESVISYWLNDRKIPLEDVQIMAGHRSQVQLKNILKLIVKNNVE